MAASTWDADTYDRDFGFVSTFGAELVDWLDPQPGERVLDLGCGTGELAARIAQRGAYVIAIDADPAMVEQARLRLPDGEVHIADGHDFAVDAPVDAVFSNAALHWMPTPVEVLGCVSDALRVGGRFVGEMGAAGNVATIMAAVDQACAEVGLAAREWPWFFPTPAEYAAILEDAGLEIRRLDNYARPTPLATGSGLLGWLHMFAAHVVADLPQPVLDRAVALAHRKLHTHDGWVADYQRLRFLAVRVS